VTISRIRDLDAPDGRVAGPSPRTPGSHVAVIVPGAAGAADRSDLPARSERECPERRRRLRNCSILAERPALGSLWSRSSESPTIEHDLDP